MHGGPGGAPAREAAATSSARTRVLFVSSNGGGMGHLTRLLAIARRLPADHEPVFLTMSTGLDAIARQGHWADHMPTAEAAGLEPARWLGYLEARVVAAVRALRPAALVFDGTYAYRGLVDAIARFPQLFAVWSRRGMWRPVSAQRRRQAEEQLGAFDLVIEPGDLAGEVDRGLTAEQRDRVRLVEPIVFLDEEELLARDAARAELGIPAGATAALVNLGAGNINELDTVYEEIARALEQHPEIHLVAAQSLIARRQLPVDPARITPLQTYPLSRVLRAFDFCVAAPGYNSFHELLAHRVPTLFIPNEETLLDDQLARATWGSERGHCLTARAGDAAALRRSLGELLRADVREELRRRCAALPPCEGAREAAEIIAGGRAAAKTAGRRAAAKTAARRARPAGPPPAGRARFTVHPVRLARRARKRIEPEVRRVVEALRAGAEEFVAALAPPADEPSEASTGRTLVVLSRELEVGEIERLAGALAPRRAYLVVLAPAATMLAMRRAGLAAELLVESGPAPAGPPANGGISAGGDGADGARGSEGVSGADEYAAERLRALVAAHRVTRILYWGDREIERPAPALALFSG